MWNIGSRWILNEMNTFFFVLLCLFYVQGRLCFHMYPLTHVHVTDLGAAAVWWAAPLEQAPTVKVPCWRALWEREGGLSISPSLLFHPGNQTSDFQLINCDHFPSSALLLHKNLTHSILSQVWLLFLLGYFGFELVMPESRRCLRLQMFLYQL